MIASMNGLSVPVDGRRPVSAARVVLRDRNRTAAGPKYGTPPGTPLGRVPADNVIRIGLVLSGETRNGPVRRFASPSRERLHRTRREARERRLGLTDRQRDSKCAIRRNGRRDRFLLRAVPQDQAEAVDRPLLSPSLITSPLTSRCGGEMTSTLLRGSAADHERHGNRNSTR